jgi:hypothetical protein
MAVKYKCLLVVQSSEIVTTITHHSYYCLNFHFLETYYLQCHHRPYWCLAFRSPCLLNLAPSCSKISGAMYDHPIFWFKRLIIFVDRNSIFFYSTLSSSSLLLPVRLLVQKECSVILKLM